MSEAIRIDSIDQWGERTLIAAQRGLAQALAQHPNFQGWEMDYTTYDPETRVIRIRGAFSTGQTLAIDWNLTPNQHALMLDEDRRFEVIHSLVALADERMVQPLARCIASLTPAQRARLEAKVERAMLGLPDPEEEGG